MFASTGLFKDIPCPKGEECILLNCIFAHKQALENVGLDIDTEVSGITNISRDDLAVEPDNVQEPARKRRRLEDATTSSLEETKKPTSLAGSVVSSVVEEPAKKSLSTSTKQNATTQALPSSHAASTKSTTRPISPPPIKTNKNVSQKVQEAEAKQPTASSPPVKKEALLPRILDHAPAAHHIRLAILKQIHAGMTTLNDAVAKDANSGKAFILSPDELIIMALDKEETTAKQSPSIYTNVLKSFIMQLRKMNLVDWKKLVTETFKSKFMPTKSMADKKPSKVITTGLTPEQEIMVLQHMRTPLEGLEKFGYVTSPPTAAEIDSAVRGVEAAGGFEVCERCASRFQVFPGRREEDGALTSGGSCTYHWARPIRPPRQRIDNVTGQREAYFPCCNENIGQSPGCTTCPHHVFKITEAKRLASILQFEKTPEQPSNSNQAKQPGAVAFDAEMGYTTKGLELIRLTAVSWPLGEELLDILVRPQGEILDLNTRFSGITLSQMANAVPYTQKSENSMPPSKSDGNTLRIVPDPATARSLLFSLLEPTTPLIGHAIDNDLNVTRIVHPFIVDTVLLYPHPKGLPIRFALKVLAGKYLERAIQNTGGSGVGEIKGHDSKEDAIATGDLVRVKVKEKWMKLKRDGWLFQNGSLVAPPDMI